MYKIFFFFATVLFSTDVLSQNLGGIDSLLNPTRQGGFNGAEIILGKAEHMPVFPGGKTVWVNYLKKNIDLTIPLRNKVPSGTYNVFIRFTVGKDSVLRNIGAESACGYGMEDEVIRWIKASPKWIPAKTSNNKTVNIAVMQVVTFKIKGTNISIQIL